MRRQTLYGRKWCFMTLKRAPSLVSGAASPQIQTRLTTISPKIGRAANVLWTLVHVSRALLSCNFASSWSPWFYATDASGGTHGGYGFTRRLCDPEDTAAAGSCAELWRLSAEEFISARRSASGELSGKCRKPVGLESKTHMFLSC